MPQTDLHFTFEPACNASDDTNTHVQFDVVEFHLVEALNAPFTLEVDLLSRDSSVDFATILDRSAVLTIWQGSKPLRRVHGLVSDFSQGETGFRRTRYHAIVEPEIARLRLRSDWRVFQQQSVPKIIAEVFKADRVCDYVLREEQQHLDREYCVQADETDFAFIERLVAEEGFVYAFTHSEQGHVLELTDTIQTLGAISGAEKDKPPEPVVYQPTPAGERPHAALWRFAYAEGVRTARQTQRDYTFKNPSYSQQHSSIGRNMPAQAVDYERYDYPGRYKQDAAGEPFTSHRLQGLRADARLATATGDDARIEPGRAFELIGHPRADLNAWWRPVWVEHHGTQHTGAEEEAAEAKASTHYEQTAKLVPATVEWKAPVAPKPRILGPQIAHVTGPDGEEIFTDPHGRVKVQFPWDRLGDNDEHSSCWIRVAQNWAGAAWGHIALPRIGQEVIVDFLDGDPDQPIVNGRTYDAQNPVPYKLPALKTQMTIKSKEHKGQGFNELLIDDTTGEIKTQIHSTHAASQLNLGYLTHPRDAQGKGSPRGEGFELRTDANGAVRAAKGLYLGTDGKAHATGGQLDISELKKCIDGLQSLVTSLLDTANANEAPLARHEERNALVAAVHQLGAGMNDRSEESGAQPVVAISAPAGIAAATPQSVMIGAGRNLELAAEKDAHVSINQQLHLVSGNTMSLFAATGGIKQIANQNDVHIQAQNGSFIAESKDTTRLTTAGHMTLVAKERLTLTCGGSYITLTESGIEFGALKAEVRMPLNVSGPATYSEQVNSWGDVKFDQRVRIMRAGTPIANYRYQLVRKDGSRIQGISDEEGWTTIQKSEVPEDFTIRLLGPIEEKASA